MSSVTEDSLGGRMGLVRADIPPRRPAGSWLPRAAAAVAVVLAVAGGALVAPRLFGHRPGPAAQGGLSGPVSDSAGPSASAKPSGSARPSAPPSGTSQPGTDLDVGVLRLTLPAGWAEERRVSRDGREMSCLKKAAAPGYCDVWVTVVDDPTTSGMSVDAFGGMMTLEAGLCPLSGGGGAFGTTTYTTRTLGDRPAEYRAYRKVCGAAVQQPEQWTVPTWPAVQITASDLRPAVRDDVHAIVSSARFTAVDTGHRVTDTGLLTAHGVADGQTTVTLDRTVWVAGGADNGHDLNDNTATYTYRVAPNPVIRDSGDLCGTPPGPPVRSCPLATVLSRIDQHATGHVELAFNKDGVVVGITGVYRP